MRDSAGYLTFTSDPRLFDTDGDGLSDGQEIGPSFNFDELPEIFGIDLSELGDGKVYTVYSDPRMDDTDADGLSDAEEADFGSRARSGETDGDGLRRRRREGGGHRPDRHRHRRRRAQRRLRGRQPRRRLRPARLHGGSEQVDVRQRLRARRGLR